MPLAPIRDTIPTSTSEQSTHNTRVVSEISRVISGAVSQSDVQSLIDSAIYLSTMTKSAAYPLVSADNGKIVLVNTTSAAVTITLPAAASISSGWNITIKALGTASTNNVTIARNSHTIDGAAADITLNTNYSFRTLVYDGSAFYIIGRF